MTADAAGICLKSGNAAVAARRQHGGGLERGVIARVLHEAAVEAGMPAAASAPSHWPTARRPTNVQYSCTAWWTCSYRARGAGLIRHCVETSKVPVIETGTGNCHV